MYNYIKSIRVDSELIYLTKEDDNLISNIKKVIKSNPKSKKIKYMLKKITNPKIFSWIKQFINSVVQERLHTKSRRVMYKTFNRNNITREVLLSKAKLIKK